MTEYGQAQGKLSIGNQLRSLDENNAETHDGR